MPQDASELKTSDADVVVIGSGAAGLMAAVEAADAGAEVCVLESEEAVGGSTWLSGAYVVLCETELQSGTREELFEDLIESHHHDCDIALSQLYVDEAASTWRRLRDLGITFVRTFQFAHMRKPWAHELSGETMGGGAEIVVKLREAAEERGVSIRTRTRAKRLIAESGRIIGVRTDGPEGASDFIARRGVVVASGGFTRNPDLVRHFGRPGAEAILPMTGQGSRGDGLLMAMTAGAGISYMTPGIAPTAPIDEATGKGVMVIYSGAVALNKHGRRFTRESDLYGDVCWAALQQTEATFVQVYDVAIRAAYAGTMMGKVLTGYREIEAPSIPLLAERLSDEFGFDAQGVAEGIARYNRAVGSGDDPEFNRTNLVGTSGTLVAIETGPFYAAICKPGTTHFNGGVRVDTAMRVTTMFGEPVPGLFAAGEVTGGFHGAGYMSGSFVGMALIFGRVAGRSAALHGERVSA